MKTITAFEKKGKKIWITVGEHSFSVEPEMIIKYHLKQGLEMEDSTYQSFILDNQYLECLRLAFLKLKKMLTIFEMKSILEQTSYPKSIQKQVIHDLIQKKYLDDISYAKTFLELKKYKEGPEMIKYHLEQKGVASEIILGAFRHYQEDVIVTDWVEKKLLTPTKKPKRAWIQQMKMQLISKGFHREVIEKTFISLENLIQDQDSTIISTYGSKIIRQYQNKLSGYALVQKIKEKLYQKGFAYEDIKRYLETIDLQSW